MKKLVIFQGKTKTGKDIVIRYPKISDSVKMCEYINILSKEKTFITYQGEQVTQEQEREFLEKGLDAIKEKKSVKLLVFHEDNLVGISGVDMRIRTSSHVGVLGISIAKEYRGEGVGDLLMDATLKEAKKELSQLKIVTLGVYSSNTIAQNMYKKFGFFEYGRLKDGIFRNNGYEDEVLMHKEI